MGESSRSIYKSMTCILFNAYKFYEFTHNKCHKQLSWDVLLLAQIAKKERNNTEETTTLINLFSKSFIDARVLARSRHRDQPTDRLQFNKLVRITHKHTHTHKIHLNQTNNNKKNYLTTKYFSRNNLLLSSLNKKQINNDSNNQKKTHTHTIFRDREYQEYNKNKIVFFFSLSFDL